MKFLSNSRQILTRAWSMYGLYAIDVLAAAEVILSLLNNGNIWFGIAIIFVSTTTKILRLLKQQNLPG